MPAPMGGGPLALTLSNVTQIRIDALFSRQQALSPLKGAKDFAFTFVRSFEAETPRFSASKYALDNYECVITDEDEGN